MSVAEIKKTKLDLIAWIEQLSDASLLGFLDGLRNSKSKTDWWNSLTETQIQYINAGLTEAENNQIVSSPEFWSKLKGA